MWLDIVTMHQPVYRICRADLQGMRAGSQEGEVRRKVSGSMRERGRMLSQRRMHARRTDTRADTRTHTHSQEAQEWALDKQK